MTISLAIDHLVYAVPDLAAAVSEIEELTGVAPIPGGAHVGRGTYNALLGLGGHTYLEIVGPDPAQPDPDAPRPFGIDDLTRPGLVTWCARADRDLEQVAGDLRTIGDDVGPIDAMSRRRPDGVVLEWRLTPPRLDDGGVIPFFIDWGTTPHPTQSLPVGGFVLELILTHPDPERIERVLSVASTADVVDDEASIIRVERGPIAFVTARLSTSHGVVVLDH
ncbi:MAG: hypothetical protein RIS41_2043 [Actinomycetota bacterium]|jgi:hypothetical protein